MKLFRSRKKSEASSQGMGLKSAQQGWDTASKATFGGQPDATPGMRPRELSLVNRSPDTWEEWTCLRCAYARSHATQHRNTRFQLFELRR